MARLMIDARGTFPILRAAVGLCAVTFQLDDILKHSDEQVFRGSARRPAITYGVVSFVERCWMEHCHQFESVRGEWVGRGLSYVILFS